MKKSIIPHFSGCNWTRAIHLFLYEPQQRRPFQESQSLYYCTILLLFWACGLYGQTAFNPNLLPLGEEEALLANTGTARSGSTGAVFYNPAGLSTVEGTSFSLSGSAYTLSHFEAQPLEVLYGEELHYSGSGYQTIPTSFIIARKMGEWRVAFSVLIPMQFRFEGTQAWRVPLADDVLDVRVLQYYREKMSLTGITLSKPINETWSWGVSVFSQYYTFTSQLDFTSQTENNTDFYLRSTERIRLNPTNLMIVGGLMHHGDRLDWGLRIALPSFHLFGRGDYYFEQYARVPNEEVQREVVETGRVRAQFTTPLDIRWGLQLALNPKWNASLDLSYGNHTEFQVFDSPAIDFREQVRNSVRISTGWERIFNERFSGFAGLSYMPTDLSTDAGLTADAFQYSSVSVGGKFSTQQVRSIIGVYFAFGQSNTKREIGPDVWREHFYYLGGFIGTQYAF